MLISNTRRFSAYKCTSLLPIGDANPLVAGRFLPQIARNSESFSMVSSKRTQKAKTLISICIFQRAVQLPKRMTASTSRSLQPLSTRWMTSWLASWSRYASSDSERRRPRGHPPNTKARAMMLPVALPEPDRTSLPNCCALRSSTPSRVIISTSYSARILHSHHILVDRTRAWEIDIRHNDDFT